MFLEVTSMAVYDSLTAWINSFLACMGGKAEYIQPASSRIVRSLLLRRYWDNVDDDIRISCLGHGTKRARAPSMDDPAKGARVVEKPSFSEDFWGTSTENIDFPTGLSQRSISTLSTSNLSFYSDLGSASTNSRNEFVNHGLLLWNQIRLQWIGVISSINQSHQTQGPAISLNASYDSLLSSKDHFRRAIPLSEMVEFLVDIWEQEGLYD